MTTLGTNNSTQFLAEKMLLKTCGCHCSQEKIVQITFVHLFPAKKKSWLHVSSLYLFFASLVTPRLGAEAALPGPNLALLAVFVHRLPCGAGAWVHRPVGTEAALL